MAPDFIGVSGLSRAVSTMLCQLLAPHVDLLAELTPFGSAPTVLKTTYAKLQLGMINA
jgi:hypothetical protein